MQECNSDHYSIFTDSSYCQLTGVVIVTAVAGYCLALSRIRFVIHYLSNPIPQVVYLT